MTGRRSIGGLQVPALEKRTLPPSRLSCRFCRAKLPNQCIERSYRTGLVIILHPRRSNRLEERYAYLAKSTFVHRLEALLGGPLMESQRHLHLHPSPLTIGSAMTYQHSEPWGVQKLENDNMVYSSLQSLICSHTRGCCTDQLPVIARWTGSLEP